MDVVCAFPRAGIWRVCPVSSPNERREGRASSIHPKGDRHLEVAELGEREVIAVVLVHGWCCAAVHRLIGDCSQCRRAKQSRAFELGTGWRRGAESQMRSIRRRRARVPPPASRLMQSSCRTIYRIPTLDLQPLCTSPDCHGSPPRRCSRRMRYLARRWRLCRPGTGDASSG